MRWEPIELSPGQDMVRRLEVPGGWLYQVEMSNTSEVLRVGEDSTSHHGWHPPVFVPDVQQPTLSLDDLMSRLNSLRGDMGTVGGARLVEIVRELVRRLTEAMSMEGTP